jgi:hypothetical protein
MATKLGAFSKAASRALLRSGGGIQQQQTRSVGNLPVHSNKYLEEWIRGREHIEETFKWDGQTLWRLFMWVGVFPYGVYSLAASEMAKADKKFGREPKKVWGGSS